MKHLFKMIVSVPRVFNSIVFFSGLWHVCFWQHFFALSKHLFKQEDNYNDLKGFLLLSSISVLTFTCVCNLHLQRYMTNLTLCFEGHFKSAIKAMAIWKPTSIYLLTPTFQEPWLCKPIPFFVPGLEHGWIRAELCWHVMKVKNYPCFSHWIFVNFPPS